MVAVAVALGGCAALQPAGCDPRDEAKLIAECALRLNAVCGGDVDGCPIEVSSPVTDECDARIDALGCE